MLLLLRSDNGTEFKSVVEQVILACFAFSYMSPIVRRPAFCMRFAVFEG